MSFPDRSGPFCARALTVVAVAAITGKFRFGPDSGRVILKTTRAGLAALAGHDLALEVTRWSARVEVPDEDAGGVTAATVTADLDLGSWTIPAGCVAGIAASWQGRVGDRTIVELRARWKKGPTLEPDWPIEDGWVIEVAGRPTVTTKVGFLPPPDFEATTFADFMVLGMIMTAMPAINAIPHVVAAPPGIVTYNDLPLPLPRGWVPRAGS